LFFPAAFLFAVCRKGTIGSTTDGSDMPKPCNAPNNARNQRQEGQQHQQDIATSKKTK
jgi:hypothetical protein